MTCNNFHIIRVKQFYEKYNYDTNGNGVEVGTK